MAITIDGKKYKVVESLGYNHSAGCYAKLVQTDDGEKMAVSHMARGGRWRFWTAADRTEPLRQNHRWPGSIG
jgi:hypothetical protein